MARTFLVWVSGLVLGAVVGLWQPRGELLAMRERLAENDREVAGLRRKAGAASVAGFFQAGRGSAPDPVDEPLAPSTGLPPPDAAANPPEAATTAAPAEDDDFALGNPEGIEAAAEALDARAAHARAGLLEQGSLDDEQLAAFDEAIDRMNQRLQGQVDALATQMAQGGEPSRRDLMELGAEGLDAMIEADDAISSILSAEQREEVDEELLDPFSHVDGTTLAGLAELEMDAR